MFDGVLKMNKSDFNELYSKLEHELNRFDFSKRLNSIYFFKRDNLILSISFESLLSLDIKCYTKIFNNDGLAIDLNYLYDSGYSLTNAQLNKVKTLINSKLGV